jgi:hypothetical protein
VKIEEHALHLRALVEDAVARISPVGTLRQIIGTPFQRLPGEARFLCRRGLMSGTASATGALLVNCRGRDKRRPCGVVVQVGVGRAWEQGMAAGNLWVRS